MFTNFLKDLGGTAIMKRSSILVLAFFSVFLMTSSALAKAPKMSDAEMKASTATYFNYCTGCHGTLRKGATGPNLMPKKTIDMGTETLFEIINEGTPGGMPGWSDKLSKDEMMLMAKFIQQEPVAPPEISLRNMKMSWKVQVPVADRPTKPQHSLNWKNFMGIVERDAGKIAIYDGDTHKMFGRVDSGFATHILRSSASGRYYFSIGRDGRVKMIDLWTKKPTIVASLRTCSEARSVDTSKFHGYEDKLAVVGCYWPPHFVVLDGATLEPLKVVSTRGYTLDGTFHPEPRVAAIVASHYSPEWVLNIKEAGFVWLVDYSNVDSLKITMIEAARFLHDGGWDITHRYFMPAANMVDQMVVIDTKERKRVAIIDVGTKPHPGRGANWTDPEFGPVHGTVHIGEGLISVWGTDPEGHPKSAWKVVRSIDLSDVGPAGGAGSLFLKTHPNSKNLWMDFTLNTDLKAHQSIGVMDINKPGKIDYIQLTTDPKARVVHQEYNAQGTEVWVSIWSIKGEIVIIDDKTRKIKTRITGLHTPTGKFNVTNTMGDIY